MNKQRGQAMVEFAFVVPFLIFLFLALIYGGLLFMDYIQYNNAARAIARAAAFEKGKVTFDDSDKANFEKKFNPLTSLYTAKISDLQKETVSDSNSQEVILVTVKIDLERNKDLKLFHILTDDKDADKGIQFPPKQLKPIIYTMPIEKSALTE